MKKFPIIFVAIFIALISVIVSAQEGEFPLVIDNCRFETTYEAPPEKAVRMNQAATVGTAAQFSEPLSQNSLGDDAALVACFPVILAR